MEERNIKQIQASWKKLCSIARRYDLNGAVILSQLHNPEIYISCLFEVDHSTVSRIIQKLEPLLAKAMPLPKERSLSQEEVMCLIDATEESIERLRRELERKITIRGRRSGIPSKPRFAQHLKEALFMSDRRFTRPH